MGFSLGYTCGLLCALLLMPTISYSQDFTSSRATFYGSPDCLGTPTGARGFGDYGRTMNDAYVAGVSRLYRNGTGCGACYKAPHLCTEDGVIVAVTDYGEGDKTDFILSTKAYARMVRPNMAVDLFASSVVDIEYRWIPCRNPGYYLVFMIHEHSRFPNYLAIAFLFQRGVNEVLTIEFWQDDCKERRGMRKAYGAVWDVPNPLKGDLTLWFLESGGAGGQRWILFPNAVPGKWQASWGSLQLLTQ